MVVRKQKNYMNTYDIVLEKDNKKLIITFQGNLDLYWGIVRDENDDKPFEITQENYAIYNAFEKLYEDIKNGNVYKVIPRAIPENEAEEEWQLESLDEEENRVKELNDGLLEYRKYDETPVFRNNRIEWHCDDEPYEESAVLSITKEGDKFLVNIEDHEKEHIFTGVRLRNSGSRHQPYNIVFMRMFNELQEYDPKHHQIHFAELEHQKKKVLKRNA